MKFWHIQSFIKKKNRLAWFDTFGGAMSCQNMLNLVKTILKQNYMFQNPTFCETWFLECLSIDETQKSRIVFAKWFSDLILFSIIIGSWLIFFYRYKFIVDYCHKWNRENFSWLQFVFYFSQMFLVMSYCRGEKSEREMYV